MLTEFEIPHECRMLTAQSAGVYAAHIILPMLGAHGSDAGGIPVGTLAVGTAWARNAASPGGGDPDVGRPAERSSPLPASRNGFRKLKHARPWLYFPVDIRATPPYTEQCSVMSSKQRRAREKEGLREEILDAARTLFVKDGYQSVSIRKIADKIEYAPGTIYLYFRDKSEILDRICEETFAKLIVRMQAIEHDTAAPLDKLRRGLRTYIQFGLDNPNHYICLLYTSDAADE